MKDNVLLTDNWLITYNLTSETFELHRKGVEGHYFVAGPNCKADNGAENVGSMHRILRPVCVAFPNYREGGENNKFDCKGLYHC